MASARFSLRWQIALWALALGLFSALLTFGCALPLLLYAVVRDTVRELIPLVGVFAFVCGSLLAASLYALLVRWVAKPADRLLVATERIGASDTGPLLTEEGPVLGRLGTAFDRMSARLLAEQERVEHQLEELRRINLALAEARDAAIRQEKLATVGRLSAGVAHEIGNPLAALLGYVELIRMLPEGPALTDTLDRMEREGRRIDRIVRDLLDFARPSRGTATQALDLKTLIEQVIRLLAAQARFKFVSIALSADDGVPCVRAEEHQLQQVLVNLLSNAADAMVGTGTITLQIRKEGRDVSLAVRDHGPGITEADLPRLFDPFFTTKDPGKGTGLGLSISLALVESFGGTITARNHPDGGAEFVVRLPVVEDQGAKPRGVVA